MINEIKNQHVHFLWALIAFKVLMLFGIRFIFIGLVIGLIVEAYQLIFKKEDWNISDRCLDVFFWLLGSVVGDFI